MKYTQTPSTNNKDNCFAILKVYISNLKKLEHALEDIAQKLFHRKDSSEKDIQQGLEMMQQGYQQIKSKIPNAQFTLKGREFVGYTPIIRGFIPFDLDRISFEKTVAMFEDGMVHSMTFFSYS